MPHEPTEPAGVFRADSILAHLNTLPKEGRETAVTQLLESHCKDLAKIEKVLDLERLVNGLTQAVRQMNDAKQWCDVSEHAELRVRLQRVTRLHMMACNMKRAIDGYKLPNP